MPCGSWQLRKGLRGALERARLGTRSELAQQEPPPCSRRCPLQPQLWPCLGLPSPPDWVLAGPWF